jgi:hypothetical protein
VNNNRPICVLDACSFIYLNRVRMSIGDDERSLLWYLDLSFSIRMSQEVSDEIRRHVRNEDLSLSLENHHKKVYKLKDTQANEYFKIQFQKNINDVKKDRGEMLNFIVAVALTMKRKMNLIFISDDERAKKNILKNSIASFPMIRIWDSCSFVLFLLSHQTRGQPFTKQMAENAIMDLISHTSNARREQLKKRWKKCDLDNDQYSVDINTLTQEYNANKARLFKNIENVVKSRQIK